jgi:hypothetical protein
MYIQVLVLQTHGTEDEGWCSAWVNKVSEQFQRQQKIFLLSGSSAFPVSILPSKQENKIQTHKKKTDEITAYFNFC